MGVADAVAAVRRLHRLPGRDRLPARAVNARSHRPRRPANTVRGRGGPRTGGIWVGHPASRRLPRPSDQDSTSYPHQRPLGAGSQAVIRRMRQPVRQSRRQPVRCRMFARGMVAPAQCLTGALFHRRCSPTTPTPLRTHRGRAISHPRVGQPSILRLLNHVGDAFSCRVFGSGLGGHQHCLFHLSRERPRLSRGSRRPTE